MGKIAKSAGASVAIIGATIVFFTQTEPTEAISNLAAWFKFFHIDAPPWLQSPQIDVYGLAIGLVLILLCFLFFIKSNRDAEAKIATLWALRDKGILLRNKKEFTGAEFENWLVDSDSWYGCVKQAAGDVDQNLKQWLHRLDSRIDKQNIIPQFQQREEQGIDYNELLEDYSDCISTISTILDRLEKFLTKKVDFQRGSNE